MTIIIPFIPPPTTAFQFTAALDGSPYTITVTWNVSAQRWYINVYDQSNSRVFTLPLIGSPDNYSISLAAGYFTTTIVYREASQQFEVSE